MQKPKIPKSNKLCSEKRVYRNPFQEIYKYTLNFGDHTKNFYVLNAAKRVGVVAEKNGAILMVRQYRLMLDGLSYEIPGGRVDDDENPKAAVIRETYEETGVICSKLKSVLFYHVGLDTNYNPTYVFYSHNIKETEGFNSFHRGEIFSFEWIPVAKCMKMIRTGKILDSMSIIALQACQCAGLIV
jgi:ADP-ribose pyrophosphatase